MKHGAGGSPSSGLGYSPRAGSPVGAPHGGAFPYLLNRPGGPLEGKPLGFAHRGGATEDENTLAAFRRAHSMGFAYLETDVRLSSDGVLYALHDPLVDRITDGTGAVADLSSAQLDGLTVHGPAAEPPARFATLLRELPDARWNVDLKAKGSARALVAEVLAAGAQDRVLVASFAAKHRREALRLCPVLPGSGGPWLVAASVFLGPIANPLLRRASRRGVVALQVPRRQCGIPVVRRAWLHRVHAAGLQVHVWVVNQEDTMRQLLKLGVDGIMTDELQVLARVLGQHGAWPQTGRVPPTA